MLAEPQDVLTGHSSTLSVLPDSGPFHGLLLTIFGVPVRFPCLLNYKVLLRAGHRHSPFWLIRSVSWAIAHLFEVLERFPRLMIPEVRLRVGHQHLQFWPILAHFVDYYSPF